MNDQILCILLTASMLADCLSLIRWQLHSWMQRSKRADGASFRCQSVLECSTDRSYRNESAFTVTPLHKLMRWNDWSTNGPPKPTKFSLLTSLFALLLFLCLLWSGSSFIRQKRKIKRLWATLFAPNQNKILISLCAILLKPRIKLRCWHLSRQQRLLQTFL